MRSVRGTSVHTNSLTSHSVCGVRGLSLSLPSVRPSVSFSFVTVVVFFEPTDTRKAVKPLQYNTLDYASPNLAELRAMAHFLNPELYTDTSDELKEAVELAKCVSSIRNIIVTLSSKGVLLVKKCSQEAQYYPAEFINTIKNVSGAGDCFAGGFIHGILRELDESACVAMGFQAAKAALMSKKTVPSDIKIDSKLQAKFSKLEFN